MSTIMCIGSFTLDWNLQSRAKYIGTRQKFTNFTISTPLPPILMLKSGKFWKKSFKSNVEFRGRGEEALEKKFMKFLCLFRLFCPRL